MRRTDRRKVFGQARKPSRVDQRAHAKKQESPRGRWAQLAASTIERRSQSTKRKRRRKLLGKLPGSLVMKHDADKLVITARPPWASVHFKGGTAGHGARIPSRQYLWISRELLRQVKKLFVAAYHRAWSEGR